MRWIKNVQQSKEHLRILEYKRYYFTVDFQNLFDRFVVLNRSNCDFASERGMSFTTYVKFVFSRKATKINEIFTADLTLTT